MDDAEHDISNAALDIITHTKGSQIQGLHGVTVRQLQDVGKFSWMSCRTQ